MKNHLFILIILLTIFSFWACKEKDPVPSEPIYHNLNYNDSLVTFRLLKYDFIDLDYVHPVTGDTNSVHALFDTITWNVPSAQLGGVVDPASQIPANIVISSVRIYFIDTANDFKLNILIKPRVSRSGTLRLSTMCTFDLNNFNTYSFGVSDNGLLPYYNDRVFEDFEYKGIQFKNASRPINWQERESINIINKECFPMYMDISRENRFFHFKTFK